MRLKKHGIAIVLWLVAAGALTLLVQQQVEAPDQSGVTQTDTAAQVQPAVSEKTIKTFSDAEFKTFFDNLSLPNTKVIVEPPEITGNNAADKHIASLAEARGYKLRLIAREPLAMVDGFELQPLLKTDWLALKNAAAQENINLEITSGYRSVDDQRELFLGRLRGAGITDEQIISGHADTAIDSILKYASPPGYSRHHSGYTIDIRDTASSVFAYSEGYRWISADNFKHAKEFGFIPSYPEEAENQGPVPEPWEFVWVNRDFLLE